MFQSRRQATLGNINLGSLSAPPSYQDMTFLLEQANRYKGRFVEISWAVPKNGATFQLTIKIAMNQPQPMWMLYRAMGGASELVWGHNSNDLTLMHNLVMLECEKPMDGSSNSISAGAMDGLMDRNMSSGSMARGQGEQQQAALRGASTPAPQSAPTNSAPLPANPAASWLQNLSYGQAEAGSRAEQAAPAPEDNSGKNADGNARSTEENAADVDTDDAVITEFAELDLEGSLSNISVPALFRYLVNNASTGRLALQGTLGAAEIFLVTGTFKHAATLDTKGESALLDVATWQDGEFHFHPEEKTTQSTISQEAKQLLAECERVRACSAYVVQAGLRPSAYLVHSDQQLSRSQFEGTLAKAGLGDFDEHWRVYEAIDNNGTISDVLRKHPMTRAEWTPIIHNLLKTGLISLSDRPLDKLPGMFLEPLVLNQQLIDQFVEAVSDPLDNIMGHGLFLYLLQHEFYRYERSGCRFALVLFSVAKTNMLDGSVSPLSGKALTEAARRIMGAKRKLDAVGHFEREYAILLPETDCAGAVVFANRVSHLLKKTPLSDEMGEQDDLIFSFGIASVPDDVRDLGTLLAAAKVAKDKSKMMGAPVVLFSESM